MCLHTKNAAPAHKAGDLQFKSGVGTIFSFKYMQKSNVNLVGLLICYVKTNKIGTEN